MLRVQEVSLTILHLVRRILAICHSGCTTWDYQGIGSALNHGCRQGWLRWTVLVEQPLILSILIHKSSLCAKGISFVDLLLCLLVLSWAIIERFTREKAIVIFYFDASTRARARRLFEAAAPMGLVHIALVVYFLIHVVFAATIIGRTHYNVDDLHR